MTPRVPRGRIAVRETLGAEIDEAQVDCESANEADDSDDSIQVSGLLACVLAASAASSPTQAIVSVACADLPRERCESIVDTLQSYSTRYSPQWVEAGERAAGTILTLVIRQQVDSCEVDIIDELGVEPQKTERFRCPTGRDGPRRMAIRLHEMLQARVDQALAMLRDAPDRQRRAGGGSDRAPSTEPLIPHERPRMAASKPSEAAGAAPRAPIRLGAEAQVGAGGPEAPVHLVLGGRAFVEIGDFGAELGAFHAFGQTRMTSFGALSREIFVGSLRARYRVLAKGPFELDAAIVGAFVMFGYRLEVLSPVRAFTGGVGGGARLAYFPLGWLGLGIQAELLGLFHRLSPMSDVNILFAQLPLLWTTGASVILRFELTGARKIVQ